MSTSVKCPQCFEDFTVSGENDPMIMDCAHTICRSCVGDMGPAARCPTCKARINFAVRDIVASQAKVLKCDNCDQTHAAEYCMVRSSSLLSLLRLVFVALCDILT
jgi:hypothetical protein